MPGHAIVQGLERRAPRPVAGQVVTAAAFSPRFDVARQLLLPAATLPSFTSSGALIAALIVIAASSEAMAGGTSRGLLAVSATVAPTAEVTTLDAVTVARHDAAAVILTAGDSRSPVRLRATRGVAYRMYVAARRPETSPEGWRTHVPRVARSSGDALWMTIDW